MLYIKSDIERKVQDIKTGEIFETIQCEVSENGYWITPNRHAGEDVLVLNGRVL